MVWHFKILKIILTVFTTFDPSFSRALYSGALPRRIITTLINHNPSALGALVLWLYSPYLNYLNISRHYKNSDRLNSFLNFDVEPSVFTQKTGARRQQQRALNCAKLLNWQESWFTEPRLLSKNRKSLGSGQTRKFFFRTLMGHQISWSWIFP